MTSLLMACVLASGSFAGCSGSNEPPQLDSAEGEKQREDYNAAYKKKMMEMGKMPGGKSGAKK
jgi:hypothetical protein